MTEETNLRQKVLKASLALIGAGGLDRLSMREAARKAGVSHQAPYHHFGDREAILAALAGEGFAKLKQELERAAASTGDDATKAARGHGLCLCRFRAPSSGLFPGDVSDSMPCRSKAIQRHSAMTMPRSAARSDDRRRFGARPPEARQKSRHRLLGPGRTASPRCCSKAVSPARSGYRRRGRGSSPRRSSKPSARFWSEAALEDAAAARVVYHAARNERDLAVS